MKIALFDIGDTLVYRQEDDKTVELRFLNQYLNQNSKDFEAIVSEKYQKFQEKLFTKSSSKTNSLFKENKFYAQYLTEILEELGLDCFSSDDISEITKLRFTINRYHLSTGVYILLQSLINSKIEIGIASNGKPSRREVLKVLGIDRFINKDLVFISDEMRLQKPEYEFFNTVSMKVRNHFKNDSHIFLIDDDLENCRIANTLVNWTSIHYSRETNKNNEILEVILNT
jgi:FMN phosphatase YigB (HAD superfamily)